jgi:inorganic triphosphatase YgiF
MVERELKLHVPEPARAGVLREIRSGKARRVTLQARYFDTPDRDLARAGIALRIRKEGRRWVQTLKAPSSDALSRIEINHIRPAADLDLSLYTGSALESFFAGLASPLMLRYETRVLRQLLTVTHGVSRIEIAFDQGEVYSGEAELPISELEFELLEGDITDVFALGAQWLQRHGLVLDLRSKAERGDALADLALATAVSAAGQATLATVSKPNVDTLFRARKAAPVCLKAKMSVVQAYVLCASECLEQIIRNAALAAGVDTRQAGEQAHIDYVHQLRVGIRRLRSCWKLFKGLVPQADAQSQRYLKQGFATLGSSRDVDVVRTTVAPRIVQAGLPPLEMSAQPGQAAQDPGMAAAAIEFQQALMRLLHDVMKISDDDEAFSVPDTAADQRLDIASDDTPAGQPSPHLAAAPASAAVSGKTRKPGKPERALKAELLKRLSTWLHQLCKKGSKFEKLPVATQHDVRKAVKNLRYCLDFAEGILPRSGTARLRVRMARIQEELGELNDYYVAQSCYQDLLPGQPQAWFALGWLAAMQAQKRARAQQLFRKLSEQSTL